MQSSVSACLLFSVSNHVANNESGNLNQPLLQSAEWKAKFGITEKSIEQKHALAYKTRI